MDRLGKLPKDLKSAYDEIYNGMSDVERKIANRAFQWVMCAREPLGTIEILPAVCQGENNDSIMPLDGLDEGLLLEYCHNLLVIDPVRDVWVPSHLSVIEYFENHLGSQSQSNCLVANVCLLLLQNAIFYDRERSWGKQEHLFHSEEDSASTGTGEHSSSSDALEDCSSTDTGKDFASKGEIELNDPLHGQGFEKVSFYARRYWMIHVRNSAGMHKHDRLSALLEDFLGLPTNSSTAYRCWHRMVTERGPYSLFPTGYLQPGDISPDSIASFSYCAFGLVEVLPHWHDYTWVKDNITTERGATFLELAALCGSVPTCRDLIKHGADVNAHSDSHLGSALAAAVGKSETVEFLVKVGGADVNMQLQCGEYGSALAAAAIGGKKTWLNF